MGTYTLKTIRLSLLAKAENVIQDDLFQIERDCTSGYLFFFVATTLLDIHSILKNMQSDRDHQRILDAFTQF